MIGLQSNPNGPDLPDHGDALDRFAERLADSASYQQMVRDEREPGADVAAAVIENARRDIEGVFENGLGRWQGFDACDALCVAYERDDRAVAA
jgi:hypothetical protein